MSHSSVDQQREQKVLFLRFLSKEETLDMAGRNGIYGKDEEERIQMLSNLSQLRLVNTCSKSFLQVYLDKLGAPYCRLVGEMREGLLAHWEKERLSMAVRSDASRATSSPSKREGESHTSLTPYQKEQAAQNPTEESLGLQFSRLFYQIIHSSSPEDVVNRGLFSPSGEAYLFLFDQDGAHLTHEQKASKSEEVKRLLTMVARFRFMYGSHEDEYDEFGQLKVTVRGHIVSPEGDRSVGVFIHFFSFFRAGESGCFVIREASFHCKTHTSYNPLPQRQVSAPFAPSSPILLL